VIIVVRIADLIMGEISYEDKMRIAHSTELDLDTG